MATGQLKSGITLQGGRYKIVRFISAGGFGCTYEGLHILLKKRVAIKEFFVKDFCNRDETTSQVTIGITAKTALVCKLKSKFIEEAQSLCALEHPNIVHVYDVFEENGTAYYVMDYIDGSSLNDIIKKDGPMSEQMAVAYIKQVAEALRYVHSLNRLHLDIKPGNIMIDKKGNAVLIDFGASKQYDEEGGENTSTLMGKTPGFAPLEQMGNDVVKFYPSTDIYSLGATLYKLLTGITPPSATLLASGEELKPLPSSISKNVCNAVYKAMQIGKNKRPQNIDEFIKMLITPIEKDNTIYDEDEGSEDKTEVTTKDKTNVRTVRKDKQKVRTNTHTLNIKKLTSKGCRSKVVAVASVVLMVIVGTIGYGVYNHQLPQDVLTDSTVSINQFKEVLQQPIKGYVTGETFKDEGGREFTYTGGVIDGKPNGKGTGIYSYGTYTGEYKNCMRHGKGKFENKDGSNKFEGTFVNNKYNIGKLTTSDGYYFEGEFKDGQPYSGKWYDPNDKFDSEVIKGK